MVRPLSYGSGRNSRARDLRQSPRRIKGGLPTRSAMTAAFSLSAAFRSLALSTPKRSFSTTPAPQTTKHLPAHIPPYPYGPRQWYKQADSGLYGGAMIRFGNKISQGRNEGKTRRSWKPNVRRKKMWSEALGEHLYIKMTRRALRTIQMEGGLDNYLLSDRPSRIKELGVFGWELRYKVIQSPAIQEQFKQERQRLNLPEPLSFEEWIKTKQNEIEARIEEQLNIKPTTRPRPKGDADPQKPKDDLFSL
ncbi:54S ribosomal protein L24 [Penicillium hispanicum]|uniref:54S ribosomal protein L24 n=1 Tax=Penicillium hispanicum TaxID=1080232 RepID=UPI0025401362|nr:54S ribosomal protein L24 [Penicillium hispanicum]KAJ5585545.1 54S ribosomal protein L24 [Penicillium hispanicum]